MADNDNGHEQQPDIVDEVEQLSEEVRSLALNLAILLAKLKSGADSERFSRLEPGFIRLVNGTVRVIQEIATILSAARNKDAVVYEGAMTGTARDQVEVKLRGILEQCNRIIHSLHQARDIIA